MAFSPIVIFRKYQKFWMAGILLMCMITFVLCTGVGGDLSEYLLKLVSSRQGKEVARVNGRPVYDQEAKELQRQRKVANDFMFNFCKILVADADKTLQESVEDGKKADDKVPRDKLSNAAAIKKEFSQRLDRKPLYFTGGTKLGELMDFKMWLIEADRLGIRLEPEFVQSLLDLELVATARNTRPRTSTRS